MQYYGWALANRDALLPTRAQLDERDARRSRRRGAAQGRLVIDYVVPDYYAVRPKACMGGWGRQFLAVSPAGRCCPATPRESMPGFDFPNVREFAGRHLGTLRGLQPLPRHRLDAGALPGLRPGEIDWGGCRCQAFALTGDAAATDPACALSPHHALVEAALADARPAPGPFRYRQYS